MVVTNTVTNRKKKEKDDSKKSEKKLSCRKYYEINMCVCTICLEIWGENHVVQCYIDWNIQYEQSFFQSKKKKKICTTQPNNHIVLV